MVGLRERQKAAREERILRAAVRLFRAEGYRAARMEDLAQLAGVAVGTLYNYHRTKGDLLVAVVALEVEEVLEAGRAIVADPPPGPRAALEALLLTYYDHSLHYLTKEMWRVAMALSIEAPRTPMGARYAALDASLEAQVADLVAGLQARGEVDPALDPRAVGRLAFNDLNQEFVAFVRDERMPLAALRERAAAQAGLMARLLGGPGGGMPDARGPDAQTEGTT
jgi:AcrR family transcriptional regulator